MTAVGTETARRAEEAEPDPSAPETESVPVPPPTALVIFGATGDLTKRKLMPALYALAIDGLLPEKLAVIGAGRHPLSDEEFRAAMRDAVTRFARLRLDEEVWSRFASGLSYAAFSETDGGLDAVKQALERADGERGTAGNRIYYFAIPPSGFAPLAELLQREGLSRELEGGGFRRMVVEKPFGRNLATARELNAALHGAFEEQQIYRIDHYLGKETVQNVLVFRFANGIFEPIWNRRYIDHIQITVAETLGVEGRGSYYEETGALRDIIQNHVMQIAALVGMEPPSNFEAETVRDEKVKLLRAIRPIHPEDALLHAVRGQYGPGSIDGEHVPGYREEPGVDPESLRETFVAMKLDVDNWRWAGTPFYLRTGKRLPSRATEIAVQFRRVPHSPFGGHQAMPGGAPPPDAIEPNLLMLRIQPDEGIRLRFGAKVPGQTMRIRSVNMDFFYDSSFQRASPDAYERLLLECMLGDPTLFAREDEVEEAWRVCTAILDGWRSHPPDRLDSPNYEAGSWGPPEADAFMRRDGREWRRP
ncbi:MAG: glucose-6-phosphate dehydrogenase [Candidatus Dormibacteria bacterium]